MQRQLAYKVLQGHNKYANITALQEHLVANFQSVNLILLLEHSPTYTTGRSMKEDGQGPALKMLGADYVSSRRGGQITFHGPGQLVGYPIIDLRHFDIGVRVYVESLQTMLIDTLFQYGIVANTTKDTGVWIQDRKIAALGIQVQRYITSHGFALNCNTDLQWFNHIVACGLVGKSVTSVSAETGAVVTVKEILPHLLQSLAVTFKVDAVKPLDCVSPSMNAEIDLFLNSLV